MPWCGCCKVFLSPALCLESRILNLSDRVVLLFEQNRSPILYLFVNKLLRSIQRPQQDQLKLEGHLEILSQS